MLWPGLFPRQMWPSCFWCFRKIFVVQATSEGTAINQGDFAECWTCRCNCIRMEEARCRNILYSYAPQMTTNRDHPNYKFLSANKELLLSKARDELEKRLLKVILFSWLKFYFLRVSFRGNHLWWLCLSTLPTYSQPCFKWLKTINSFCWHFWNLDFASYCRHCITKSYPLR